MGAFDEWYFSIGKLDRDLTPLDECGDLLISELRPNGVDTERNLRFINKLKLHQLHSVDGKLNSH